MIVKVLVIEVAFYGDFIELPSLARELLMDGLRAIVEAGGNLNLTDADEFHFAWAEVGSASVPVGVLTVRDNPNDGGKWIQAAYTTPSYRNSGVFRRLADHVAQEHPKKVIGLGTSGNNLSMLAAAKRAGFIDVTHYCYRRPQ